MKKTLKKNFNIVWYVLVAIAFCGFIVLSFLHNAIDKTLGQWVWYPCLAVLLIYSFIPNKKMKEQSKFVKIFYSGGMLQLLFIISGIFVINYYETGYNWYWFAFALIALSIPIGGVTVKAWAESKNNYSTEQIKAADVFLCKYIMFYWLLDLFYMACFNQWLVFQFIFGGVAMLIVFYSLTVAFLSESKTNKWLLLTDFLFGVGLTVYLIYIIPNDSLQAIVISIVSAVYGGLLTLVGVAWTIKDNNNKKRQDELNKAKPMFSLMTDFQVVLNSVYPTIPFSIQNYSSLCNVCYIGLFMNSDNSSFYVKSVYAHSFGLLTPTTNNVALKNQCFKIIINSDNAHKDKVIFLTIEDIFGRCFYATETIKGYRRVLRTLFNEAVRYDWIAKNPVCKTKIGAGNNNTSLRAVPEKEVFSFKEAQEFLAALDRLPRENINYKVPIKLMLLTGVRNGELHGLRWEDIDFEKKVVHVRRNRLYNKEVGIYEKSPKTRTSVRDIPLTDDLVKDLMDYADWFREADDKFDDRKNIYYIVSGVDREPLYPQTISNWLGKFEIKNGFKRVTCHGLRHTYCSLLLSQNVPIQTVSKYMGHSDSTVTLKVYSHFIPDTQEKVVFALNNLTKKDD